MWEVEMATARAKHLTFDHAAKDVTWELKMSKTDSMALGTTCALGCLFGVPTLPCPYHIARDHVDVVLGLADGGVDYPIGLRPMDFSCCAMLRVAPPRNHPW